ncbi:alternative oxidase-domain-containing protein [Phaeosphaeriaceae sp. PMI808]|nr:alternative oxidase-domain-containing protein [Phaeosphaeriaceae sp. PMI808]
MISTRTVTRASSRRVVAQALRLHGSTIGSRTASITAQHIQPTLVGQRHFSSSPNSPKIKEFFEKKETNKIRRTPAAWAHPTYTQEQMNNVAAAHREAKTTSDKLALVAVKVLRWGLDKASGYRHEKAISLHEKDPEAAQRKYGMTEEKYLIRNVFLESVAGVPGMVAGMLRHLQSMRRMKRDNGWIETLLEESYNERMHLLIFLKMQKPGLFMRAFVLGAQGVWFNALFFAYLISPRIVHRFVGYLEEEAVLTYTRQIKDLDAGRLPKWEKMQAPEIAVDYWHMPEGHRSMRDLLLQVRSDESKHAEVNHTFGNLDPNEDANPYVSEYKDPEKPHPSKDLAHPKPTGWERHEVI